MWIHNPAQTFLCGRQYTKDPIFPTHVSPLFSRPNLHNHPPTTHKLHKTPPWNPSALDLENPLTAAYLSLLSLRPSPLRISTWRSQKISNSFLLEFIEKFDRIRRQVIWIEFFRFDCSWSVRCVLIPELVLIWFGF